MKFLKYFLTLFVVLFFLFRLSIYIFRLPSYTIQTSGKLYIINKQSRNITVFDLFNKKKITDINIDIEAHAATASSDKKKVIISNYKTSEINGKSLQIINTKTYKIEKTIEYLDGFGLFGIIAFPESNNIGVVSCISNELFVINIETNTIIKKIATRQEVSNNIVIHPSKSIAYVTNKKSNSVSVIDIELNKVIKIISCGYGTQAIAITPDASEIWVTNTRENLINVISTTSNSITKTFSIGKESLNLKFSIGGKYCLVTNSKDGTVSVYNQKSKNLIKKIHLHGKDTILERLLYHTPRPVNIIMHPNGLYAFVTNSNASKVEVIDMKTFTIVSTIETGEIPDAMVFIP